MRLSSTSFARAPASTSKMLAAALLSTTLHIKVRFFYVSYLTERMGELALCQVCR